MQNIKCVVVGDKVIGKTCMLESYTTNSFPSNSTPTVFDNYSANVSVKGTSVSLSVWEQTYENTDIFLVCFAINSQSSFNSVTDKWLSEIRKHCRKTPILLVGTRMDLRDDENSKNIGPDAILTPEHGEKLARKIGAFKYVECSALTQKGLKEVFYEAATSAISAESESNKDKNCIVQ